MEPLKTYVEITVKAKVRPEIVTALSNELKSALDKFDWLAATLDWSDLQVEV